MPHIAFCTREDFVRGQMDYLALYIVLRKLVTQDFAQHFCIRKSFTRFGFERPQQNRGSEH